MQVSSSRSERGLARVVRRAVAGLAATVLSVAALAHDDSPHNNELPAAWDFMLPSLDGKRFVQVSELRGPVLVNFWGRDCAPCVAELPRLQTFARDNPAWTVLLVATDAPADASAFLEQHGITLQALRGGARAGALMRASGNRHGVLPFTLALRAGNVCQARVGEVSASDLAATAARCAAP